jgi:hypothetical protein
MLTDDTVPPGPCEFLVLIAPETRVKRPKRLIVRRSALPHVIVGELLSRWERDVADLLGPSSNWGATL